MNNSCPKSKWAFSGIVTTQGKGPPGGSPADSGLGSFCACDRGRGPAGRRCSQGESCGSACWFAGGAYLERSRAAGGGPWVWAPGLSLETVSARAPGQEWTSKEQDLLVPRWCEEGPESSAAPIGSGRGGGWGIWLPWGVACPWGQPSRTTPGTLETVNVLETRFHFLWRVGWPSVSEVGAEAPQPALVRGPGRPERGPHWGSEQENELRLRWWTGAASAGRRAWNDAAQAGTPPQWGTLGLLGGSGIFIKRVKKYLFMWLPWVLVVAWGIFRGGMWTLMWHTGSSFLTRDWTWAPCIGSTESWLLDHQGSSYQMHLKK